jgi:hypothetical protein
MDVELILGYGGNSTPIGKIKRNFLSFFHFPHPSPTFYDPNKPTPLINVLDGCWLVWGRRKWVMGGENERKRERQ